MTLEFGCVECARFARNPIGRQPIAAMALATVLFVTHSAETSASGDPVRGEMIYRDCMICHSLDQSGIRSKHRGVFGRKAGTTAGYDYSAALKSSNIVWSDDTLDR